MHLTDFLNLRIKKRTQDKIYIHPCRTELITVDFKGKFSKNIAVLCFDRIDDDASKSACIFSARSVSNVGDGIQLALLHLQFSINLCYDWSER